MPGGYGQIGTPWGRGGTSAGATVAQTSGFGGGQGGQGGFNEVADAVNKFQKAKREDKSPEVVQDLQKKAIRSIAWQQALSGADTTAEGQFDRGPAIEEADIIQQKITDRITQQQAEEAERARIDALPKKGIFGLGQDVFSSLPLPGLPNILKGAQSTDRFFKKLASGKPLDPEDKIILAHLIAANKENPNVLGDWKKYAEKFDVADAKGFKSSLDEAVSDLENTDYQSLIDEYLDRKPEGFKESLGAMYDDFGNLVMGKETSPEGIMTLENLKKELGPQGLAFLKANDPAAYYSFIQPQTTGGLEELAGLDAQKFAQSELPDGSPNPNYNPDMAQTIFNARNELDRQTGGQGGGGGAGIMGAVPTPFTDVNNNGILDSLEVAQATTTPAATTTVPAATTTAATMTTPTPFDYSQWPQYAATNQYSWPNYVNQ